MWQKRCFVTSRFHRRYAIRMRTELEDGWCPTVPCFRSFYTSQFGTWCLMINRPFVLEEDGEIGP